MPVGKILFQAKTFRLRPLPAIAKRLSPLIDFRSPKMRKPGATLFFTPEQASARPRGETPNDAQTEAFPQPCRNFLGLPILREGDWAILEGFAGADALMQFRDR